jgi:hypothetical protein
MLPASDLAVRPAGNSTHASPTQEMPRSRDSSGVSANSPSTPGWTVPGSRDIAVNVTVDTTGGFPYGTGTVNIRTNAFSNGKVTGGTGIFKGATGTIKAKAITNKKEAVTITYST